ncbi:hypothetical protein GT347_09000 [Xylophilus rhododendri]|uniref:Uncharacterized protein n=1 Tax=Xylophilus rhododendri TaxID=2697032 RepID=A0A857J5K1_9BURK|nr:RHS repeat-associated core domain-containing protein [Xylophilus rhododendri]QHI98115.1 hypothetical protein GT347_09000 [Xylophilus rhododendri]
MTQPALFQDTPTVTVRDNRGLTVRTVEYNRVRVEDARQACITRAIFNRRGQLVETLDPRLCARREQCETVTPNLAYGLSLSGQAIRVESVDAGTQVVLADIRQAPLLGVDARMARTRTEYDAWGRPAAVFQALADTAERCTERFEYGMDPRRNNCGLLIRHDDGAGSLQNDDFSIGGQAKTQTRRLLQTLKKASSTIDWPAGENARDLLLGPQAFETRWQFDALAELVEQTDAKGHRQVFSHDLQGRLSGVSLQIQGGPTQILADQIVYNAAGQLIRERAANGVVTESIFDARSQRLSELKSTRGREILQHLRHEYDPAGNIVRIEDLAQDSSHHDNSRIDPISTYRYDAIYQLIEATGRENLKTGQDDSLLQNYRRHWSYDAAGNLLKMVHAAASGSFTQEMEIASNANRSMIKSAGMTLADAFDAHGNLLVLNPGQMLNWNASNQLEHVSTVRRDDAEDDGEYYAYGADRQRVCKSHHYKVRGGSREDRIIYLPGIELRTGAAEELQVIKIHTGGQQIQVLHWTSAPPQGVANDQIRYSLGDHLGSSRLELDQQARIISREEYYPFGATAVSTARSATEAQYKFLRYSGKERDATGLYDYGFRYYAPWLMRWTNPDPAGAAGGLNLYRMVRNNPLTLVDGNGLAPAPIPKNIFQIWIGPKLIHPTNMYKIRKVGATNPDYRHTVLVDSRIPNSAAAIQNLQEKLSPAGIRVQDISQMDWPSGFRARDLYDASVRDSKYAQAADVLRYNIIYEHGGVYVDADDNADTDLPFGDIAPELGIATGGWVTVPESHPVEVAMANTGFGAQPHHEVLETVLGMAEERFAESLRVAGTRQEGHVFHMSGPFVFTEALRRFNRAQIERDHRSALHTARWREAGSVRGFLTRVATGVRARLNLQTERPASYVTRDTSNFYALYGRVNFGSDHSWARAGKKGR